MFTFQAKVWGIAGHELSKIYMTLASRLAGVSFFFYSKRRYITYLY
jgi:hypothetical protein